MKLFRPKEKKEKVSERGKAGLRPKEEKEEKNR